MSAPAGGAASRNARSCGPSCFARGAVRHAGRGFGGRPGRAGDQAARTKRGGTTSEARVGGKMRTRARGNGPGGAPEVMDIYGLRSTCVFPGARFTSGSGRGRSRLSSSEGSGGSGRPSWIAGWTSKARRPRPAPRKRIVPLAQGTASRPRRGPAHASSQTTVPKGVDHRR